MSARSFVLYRHVDPSGISGTGTVAEGTQWSDGTVSLRWKGPSPSFSNWESLGVMLAAHGHQGATEVRWLGKGEFAHVHELVDVLSTGAVDAFEADEVVSHEADDCDQDDPLAIFDREDR